jgi:hypothetical protein
MLTQHLTIRDMILDLTNLPGSRLSADCALVWAWGVGSTCALFERNQSVQPEAAIGRHLLSLASKTCASMVLKDFPDMPIIFTFGDNPVAREFWIVGPCVYPPIFVSEADSC